ncbi:hypothetical protein Taro_033064 [Colocasia esculenta]|uniref:Pectinesterase n=1 Tax=Colocasia esculenta TaxID=4460 RepID=A0A843W7Y4_COLES|nr:hypothetical protein [Colocasia esculenta]
MDSSTSHPPLPLQPSNTVLLLFLSLLLLLPPSAISTPTPNPASINSSSLPDARLATIRSLCKSTPHPDACFDSLKLTININIIPNILGFVFQVLQSAINEAAKLSPLFAAPTGIIEKLRGSLQDCRELHEATLISLRKSSSLVQSGRNLSDVRTHLSAALTNRATCLEGLASATGPLKRVLLSSVAAAYKHVTNSLAMLPKEPRRGHPKEGRQQRRRRRLLGTAADGGFPAWLSHRDRRLLQSSDDDDNGYDTLSILTVAADGTGNFTTVSGAIAFAPNNSADRTIIIVRAGVYEENVEVPSYKPNLVLLGDGSDVTIIRGIRSNSDGWTTFRSATVAVSAEGFLARDIAFDNAAGVTKGQAVALRVNADLVAFYRCAMTGYQDTLYVHTFRQFYRECDIFGTIDFIFGNAAVVFQGCKIYARVPIPGQANAITAQGRDDPNENTGISIQNCSIMASGELTRSGQAIKTYLGRPWKLYSRTVYMQSFIDGLVDPAGWAEWVGDEGLKTLYYGEYDNTGPGSGTDDRVTWPGYHVMTYDDAIGFTVTELIAGDQWLQSTSFPFDDWV